MKYKSFFKGTYNEKSHNENLHHRQLRGSERKTVKEMLKIDGIQLFASKRNVELENNEKLRELFENGNDANFIPKNVLKKASSELKSDGRVTDDFLDLVLQRNSIEKGLNHEFKVQFLQKVSLPFEIISFTENQMQLMRNLKDFELNIDATGRIIRKSKSIIRTSKTGIIEI